MPDIIQDPRNLLPWQLLTFCRDRKLNSKTRQKDPDKKLTKEKHTTEKVFKRMLFKAYKIGFLHTWCFSEERALIALNEMMTKSIGWCSRVLYRACFYLTIKGINVWLPTGLIWDWYGNQGSKDENKGLSKGLLGINWKGKLGKLIILTTTQTF